MLVERLQKGGVVAEIGVAFGEFTDEILLRAQPRRLHLIDAWSSPRYQEGLDTIKRRHIGEVETGRIVINQGLSTEQLATFDDAYFDWVYIDTDHTYETTSAELRLARRKVKQGGRIAGHDFTSGNCVTPWPYGVIEACNEFCMQNDWAYEWLTLEPHGHFSFALFELR